VSHHIVELKDVYFNYPDGTETLKGISLRIVHGESVGIIGANGAGKSTLLMHLNGYLMPSKGAITIGDYELNKKTRSDIRKNVGVVFQNPDDQLFMPTVFDDVAFGPLNLGLSREKVQKRVQEALEIVGCFKLKDKPPHHLSSGQKSAVAIASVIAMHPDILVMDEPASSLDPKSRRYLIDLLKDFRHTKIVASHDLDLILDVCKRCIIIKDGRIAADGPSVKILSDKKLLEENNLELPLSLQRFSNNDVKEKKMDDMSKLKHLIEHWEEHNTEHAETYIEWAKKAGASGKKELSGILNEIADETRKISRLLEKAKNMA
jgi:cobalt/nickel transport system ATP-binding protein